MTKWLLRRDQKTREKHCEVAMRCENREIDFINVVMSEERNFPSLAFTLDKSDEPVVVISQRRLAI